MTRATFNKRCAICRKAGEKCAFCKLKGKCIYCVELGTNGCEVCKAEEGKYVNLKLVGKAFELMA